MHVFRNILAGAVPVLLMSVLPSLAPAQAPPQVELVRELRKAGDFSDEDIERLNQGETLIRELPRSVKWEVAMIGVVRLEFAFPLVEQGLKRTVDEQRNDSAREYGVFSDPPKPADLKSLEFDGRDLDDLKACRVESCQWNLSANLIEELSKQVSWNSPDSRDRASEILKNRLAAYVRHYASEGDSALMVYRDTGRSVSLADDYEGLLKSIPLVDEFHPEFGDYARRYPGNPLKGVDNVFNWSEVKVGLKPVVMITQTMSFSPGDESMYSISKQIFANHYFDSSLGVTALFSYPSARGRPLSYLVFISRTRSSALRGRLSGLLRGLIEDQAKGKLQGFLADAKRYTALAAANKNAAAERKALLEEEQARAAWTRTLWIAVPIAVILIAGLVFLLMKRRSGKP